MLALTLNVARRPPPRARVPLLLAFVLAAAAALAWLVTNEPQRVWERDPGFDVSLAGEHYRLDPEVLAGLTRFSVLHFAEGEEAARALAAEEIGTRLDGLFGVVEARLPEMGDWYYSLAGEYTRLAMMALSWTGLADGDYAARRAAEMLFPEDVWDVGLFRLEQETAERLQSHHARVREGWLAELTERLSAHRVPAPLAQGGVEHGVGGDAVRLDALLEELMARERGALQTRASISTMAAGGAALGPAVWRAAARLRTAGAGRALTRGAGRGAARAGSAAAGGAAVCAPGGPLALGCAAVAGTATWIAADWVLLRIDEYANRDALMEALRAALDVLRADMERELLAAHDELISTYYGTVREDIRQEFIPARRRADP